MPADSSFENRVQLREKKSNGNSTTQALANSESFTGKGEASDQPYIAIFCYTDQDGTLLVQYSEDGESTSTWYTIHTISVVASNPEIHVRSKVGLPFVRVKFTNDSGSGQTTMALHTRFVYYDDIVQINDTLTADTGAKVTRSILSVKDSSGNPVDLKGNASGELFVTTTGAALDDTHEFSEDTSFVAGDSPATFDINTALGRNATGFTIWNDGPGDFTYAYSSDGASFGDEIRITYRDYSHTITDVDVDSVRVTHTGTDSAYRITAI